MKTLIEQSIRHAIRENFKTSEKFYPIQKSNSGVYPTDEFCDSLRGWVELEYDNCDDLEKGELCAWKNIAIYEAIDYFELQIGDYDEDNVIEDYLLNNI